MQSLASELSIPVAGRVESLDRDRVVLAIQNAADDRSALLRRLAAARRELSCRARENLAFLRASSPYAGAQWVETEVESPASIGR